MKVTRVWESPRVTKPYTDAQWLAIDALGRRIDGELERGDVRLTMGGEPTFVAAEDREGAEWNTEAMGPTKRRFGAELLARLKARYAPGGLLHYGQGKWYPGEQLPRWAFSLYWRRDGKNVWSAPALIADESKDFAPTVEQAAELLGAMTARLCGRTRRCSPTRR